MRSPSELLLSYLRAYESKDIKTIESMFSASVRLQDWNLVANGKAQAVAETRKNFEAVQELNIEVLRVYESGLSAAAELRITVDRLATLEVVDSVTFSPAGQIESIRAYKG